MKIAYIEARKRSSTKNGVNTLTILYVLKRNSLLFLTTQSEPETQCRSGPSKEWKEEREKEKENPNVCSLQNPCKNAGCVCFAASACCWLLCAEFPIPKNRRRKGASSWTSSCWNFCVPPKIEYRKEKRRNAGRREKTPSSLDLDGRFADDVETKWDEIGKGRDGPRNAGGGTLA